MGEQNDALQTPENREVAQAIAGLLSRRTLLGASAAVAAMMSLQNLRLPAAYAATGAQIPLIEHYNDANEFGDVNDGLNHRGIDLAPPFDGPRPVVVAAASGVVTSVLKTADNDTTASFGNYVELYHGKDAAGNDWHTRYHMLHSGFLPDMGQEIAQGSILSYVGDQHVVNSTGPHLHFEICTTATDAGTFYDNTYDSGYRRCVDPRANIDRVPTHNYNNPQPPAPQYRQGDLVFIAIRNGWFGLIVPQGNGKNYAVVLGGQDNADGIPTVTFNWDHSWNIFKNTIENVGALPA